jgi:hypothetical protein
MTRRAHGTAASQPQNARSVHRRHRRRGLILLAAGIGGLILIILATTLGRLTILGVSREQLALLDAYTEQAFESGRAWANVHPDRLLPGQPVTLPLDGVLPSHLTGTLELTVAEADERGRPVVCRVRIERPRRGVDRERTWRLRP